MKALESTVPADRIERTILLVWSLKPIDHRTPIDRRRVRRTEITDCDFALGEFARNQAYVAWRSRSQSVMLKPRQNLKYLPLALTERGTIMAAKVLNSPQAVQNESGRVVGAALRSCAPKHRFPSWAEGMPAVRIGQPERTTRWAGGRPSEARYAG